MRTSFADFLYSGTFIVVAGSLSFFIVRLVVTLVAPTLAGGLAVLVYVFAWILCFGLLVGVFVRACIHFFPLPHGTFSMDHPAFSYWKILSYIEMMGESCVYPTLTIPVFAPLRPWVCRLFGARVGSETAIAGTIDSPYLTTIGDRSVIGARSYLTGNTIRDGHVFIGPVTIGNDVTICMDAIILPNVQIGDGAVVEIGAVVLPGSVIPAGEKWRGNPARKWMGAE